MIRWIAHIRLWRHGIPVLLAVLLAGPAAAADPARQGCAAMAARVAAVAGAGPVFLRSYDGESGEGPPAEPALATAAFTYDNALAAIALLACGRDGAAGRIGLALAAAAERDRAGLAGRLRNAYRAGAQDDPPPPNGWWDVRQGRWFEDAYQVGTATGNVAWAGLALATLGRRLNEPRFTAAAERLAGWAVAHAATPFGFSGGVHGEAAGARRLSWKSTEHNIDLAALFALLPGEAWRARQRNARAFVASMWDAGEGRFLTGTKPDGVTPDRDRAVLDVQLWANLLADADPAWRRALDHALAAHAAEGGLDFDTDRDGMWVEGTAQGALALRRAGRGAEADALLAVVARETSPGGYLWATRRPSISTGLALGPDSSSADFRYYRRPHLGATAWAVLAALGWNPFTGGGG